MFRFIYLQFFIMGGNSKRVVFRVYKPPLNLRIVPSFSYLQILKVPLDDAKEQPPVLRTQAI